MRKFLFLIAALLISSAVADIKLVTSEFTAKNFAEKDIVGWTANSYSGSVYTSDCGGVTLYGGYNIFGYTSAASKDYNSGVDHFELTISFDLYSVDSWGKQY